MSWFARLPRQKANQPIAARTINETAAAAEWASRITAAPPLAIVAGLAGPLIKYMGPIFGVYIVVTSGTITARVGTTPGAGTCIVQTWNGSVLANLQSSGSVNVTIPVLSISSTTGGIPTGTYGLAIKIAGAYWLCTVDCGN